ncbi:molybdate ABC transporter substrate-binding protein [Azospirillum sp.]|uniref:molybdate ABC transporter substrate-binding protein n=1 Tax=Azospirillum sp. TaxID=34012 RepID=UPI003D7372C6
MKTWITAALLAFSTPALAGEVQVLSAGAVEPGLMAVADAYKRQTGDAVTVRFATAPALRKKIADGEVADVLLAPPAVLDEAAAKLMPDVRAEVGKVGVGVAVRDGAPKPDVSSAEALKAGVRGAESLVFNQASTGVYVEGLLQKLGLWDEAKAKTTRYPDGAAVMEHLIKGKGAEVGFGAITEIMLYRGKGLTFVGPLPAEVQNVTRYAAAALAGAPNPEGARAFVRFLGSPEAKALLVAAGVE